MSAVVGLKGPGTVTHAVGSVVNNNQKKIKEEMSSLKEISKASSKASSVKDIIGYELIRHRKLKKYLQY